MLIIWGQFYKEKCHIKIDILVNNAIIAILVTCHLGIVYNLMMVFYYVVMLWSKSSLCFITALC